MESEGAGSSAEAEDTRQNTLRNSGNLQSGTGTSRTPANPFKKTLASRGTESRPGPPGPSSDGRSMEAEPKIARPHYDVDDFKKLLLTGEKSVSSSNTDASSMSRQSIFEPASGPLLESPRTSEDSIPSDEERQRLVGGMPLTSDRMKPSPPRPRHGKLVKSNAPQTVSFEDPTLSFLNSAIGATVPVDQSMPEIQSDVDKPLPPLPPSVDTQSSKQNLTESTGDDTRGLSFKSEDAPSSNLIRKRSPPAPPLSRTHGQLRAKPSAGNNERSMPMTEGAPRGSISLSQSAPAVGPKVPPPPPPRRAGPVRGNSSSSMSTRASFTSMSDQPDAADVSTRSAKARPPVPPNRSPSALPLNRPHQTQLTPESSSVAPPPPPRRRGSSQSSYTPSRLSGHYTGRLRSDSGASSISHLAMTPVGPTSAETENKDVMADLSALQREVDELRGKFKG